MDKDELEQTVMEGDGFAPVDQDEAQTQEQVGESKGFEMTPENLQTIVGTAVQQGMQQVQPQQQPMQMSEEEVSKALNIYTPNADLFTKMRDAFGDPEGDPQRGAELFQEMWQGMSGQAKTYAELYAQHAVQEVMQQVQPMLDQSAKSQQQGQQDKFFKSYPSLKAYESLLPGVAEKLSKSGMQFRDNKHANEELAKAARSAIRQFQPDFQLQAASVNGRKSAALAFGGQQGAGTQQRTGSGSASIWR